MFDVFKALHIVFMVMWFGGMFYMVRLLTYYAEAEKKEDGVKQILQNQYQKMMKRLWYFIAYPGMTFTLVFGITMLVKDTTYLKLPYMHIKLTLIVLLIGYHHVIGAIYKKQKNGSKVYAPIYLRLINEISTLFLFAIVFVIVLQNKIIDNWYWSVLSLIVISALIYLGVIRYKNKRQLEEIKAVKEGVKTEETNNIEDASNKENTSGEDTST